MSTTLGEIQSKKREWKDYMSSLENSLLDVHNWQGTGEVVSECLEHIKCYSFQHLESIKLKLCKHFLDLIIEPHVFLLSPL